MSEFRTSLPQVADDLFLTDSGLETDLIFNGGFELPEFASFVLLNEAKGRTALADYFDAHAGLAAEHGVGIVLESPTWRASADWGARVDYSASQLDEANRSAIQLLSGVRQRHSEIPVVISGNIGPRGDAYHPDSLMNAGEAQHYHSSQINTFADTEADLVTAMTLTYVDEGVGIARAAQGAGMPVVLSFTVETDGRLPDGTSLAGAIYATDAATGAYPSYYMVNCAHPDHFTAVLDPNEAALARIRGVRANASRMSHEELDEVEVLDAGNADELARDYLNVRSILPGVTVLGGCCGTDVSHIASIAQACLPS